jgi:hypothetical protein
MTRPSQDEIMNWQCVKKEIDVLEYEKFAN